MCQRIKEGSTHVYETPIDFVDRALTADCTHGLHVLNIFVHITLFQ